jgi:hypothetical protein
MNIRLENKDPGIVQRLKKATEEEQRGAAVAVAEWALRQNELGDEEFVAILSNIRLTGAISSDDKVKLEGLIEQFDDQYFHAQDEGAAEAEYLDKFGKARAVSALLFAGSADAFAGAAEAIYEASVSTQNESQLLKLVQVILPK